jgi:hypothetical protein
VDINGSIHSAAREVRNGIQLVLKRLLQIVIFKETIIGSRKRKKPRCGNQAMPRKYSTSPYLI